MRRLLLLLCGICLMASALAADKSLKYTQWATTANVSPDNTWTMHEDYHVFFRSPHHGMYRYLRTSFKAWRNIAPDGEPEERKLIEYVSDVKVTRVTGDEASTYTEDNGTLVVRIGSADRTVIGDKGYSIDYTYRYHDDRVRQRDYLFHSLLPDDVQCDIDVFTFEVRFVKPLPADIGARLNIYGGGYGRRDTVPVENLVVTPTLISGTVRDIPAGSAMTLFAELPEGYYEGVKTTPTWPAQCAWAISVVLICLLLYWQQTDRGPGYTRTVEFYAPKGVTPAEVGKIIDDSSDVIDITSMVPWLASQGYLTIEDIPKEKGLFGKPADVKLTKVKPLPSSAPRYQQRIMSLLFEGSSELLVSKMGDRHEAFRSATSALDDYFNGERKLMAPRHIGAEVLLMVSSTLALAFSSWLGWCDVEFWLTAGLVWLLPMAAAFGLRFYRSAKDAFQKPSFLRWIFVLRFLAWIFTLALLLSLFDDVILHLWQLVVLSVGSYLVIERTGRLVHDTPFRAQLKGKLLGFKDFIDTAEKDRLRMLVDQDPEYFYKVLPYAMVFGLSNKWVDLFKGIDVKPATWYSTTADVTSMNYINGLASNLTRSVGNAIRTASVDPCSSDGSGSGNFSFSTGGYSGGGGGGGGAGGW